MLNFGASKPRVRGGPGPPGPPLDPHLLAQAVSKIFMSHKKVIQIIETHIFYEHLEVFWWL